MRSFLRLPKLPKLTPKVLGAVVIAAVLVVVFVSQKSPDGFQNDRTQCFNPVCYANNNPDLKQAFGAGTDQKSVQNLWNHWYWRGGGPGAKNGGEGRNPCCVRDLPPNEALQQKLTWQEGPIWVTKGPETGNKTIPYTCPRELVNIPHPNNAYPTFNPRRLPNGETFSQCFNRPTQPGVKPAPEWKGSIVFDGRGAAPTTTAVFTPAQPPPPVVNQTPSPSVTQAQEFLANANRALAAAETELNSLLGQERDARYKVTANEQAAAEAQTQAARAAAAVTDTKRAVVVMQDNITRIKADLELKKKAVNMAQQALDEARRLAGLAAVPATNCLNMKPETSVPSNEMCPPCYTAVGLISSGFPWYTSQKLCKRTDTIPPGTLGTPPSNSSVPNK